MFAAVSSLGPLGLALLAGLAVLGWWAGVSGIQLLRNRRRDTRGERIARWQADPMGMARATAALFQEARAALTAKAELARTRLTHATARLEVYEQSLPPRPAWKWAMLIALIPLSAVLVYTQIISDVASFAAQGRAREVALVLGMALAISLFAIPLFIRVHTLGMERGAARAGWYAGLVMFVVFLAGVAAMIAGSRVEAHFIEPISQATANLAYYTGLGDALSADVEQQTIDDLRAQRQSVADQDRNFAAGLALASAALGWLEADSLAGLVLLAQRANRRRLQLAVVRMDGAVNRLDRRVQTVIVRRATEAGVLNQLPTGEQNERPAPQRALALPVASSETPEPEPSENVRGHVISETLPAASDDGDAAPPTPPAGSTTPHDDNL